MRNQLSERGIKTSQITIGCGKPKEDSGFLSEVNTELADAVAPLLVVVNLA